MNNSVKLLLAGAVMVLGMSAAPASAASTLDVVRDKEGTPVKAMSGDCLRTNWADDTEGCDVTKVTETKAVYFAFGKSTLSADGKKALDALAKDIKAKGAAVTAVRVAGFADRIGNAASNEKLSKKRADTVRKYLVSKGIVKAQVVETRWFGDSVPATQCAKDMPKAKLIKCLQPDRRVEVEVDTMPAAAMPVKAEPVKKATKAKKAKK